MLDALITALRSSRGLAHKRDIGAAVRALDIGAHSPVRVGDDCAAIADGDGHLLFAIEGFIQEFVEFDPWFAGWCGVMVNLSDIYAMGGRPLAVVDAIWSRGEERMRAVLEGMAAAARAYRVPVVGGHSNAAGNGEQLAVAVLGRASSRLLTSFDARPGDALLLAVDLRGAYREPYPHWNCATHAPPQRLRDDLEILPGLAESGLCAAAKDVSQAGILGTAMMLLETSGVGAAIDIDTIPMPPGCDPQRWLLSSFPSYGFVLAVPPAQVPRVRARFHGRDLACAVIGACDDSRQLQLRAGGQPRLAWDFRSQAVTGCAWAAGSNLVESVHA